MLYAFQSNRMRLHTSIMLVKIRGCVLRCHRTALGRMALRPKKRYINAGDDLAMESNSLWCRPLGVIAGAIAMRCDTLLFKLSLKEKAANIWADP